MNRNVCTTSNVIGTGATIAVATFLRVNSLLRLITHFTSSKYSAFYTGIPRIEHYLCAQSFSELVEVLKLEVFNALDSLRTNFRNLSS